MTDLSDDIKIKRGDLLIKIVGTLLTVVTIIVGLIQYTHKQSHENYMEFKRAVWKKQLDTYSQACKYAGLIATNPTDIDFPQNVKIFGGLYWGEMIMVEDTLVEKAMKDFYYSIIDYNKEDPQSHNKLKYKADQLSKACRESSRRTWLELK